MRLADLPKYFSPKSPMFSDSPAATATDSLSITDVMASLGLATAKAWMGIELFLAKHGINQPDEAVESLYQYVKWFNEFGHLNRGDMLTSKHHR